MGPLRGQRVVVAVISATVPTLLPWCRTGEHFGARGGGSFMLALLCILVSHGGADRRVRRCGAPAADLAAAGDQEAMVRW